MQLKDLKEKMKDLQIQDHEVTEELEVLKAKVDKHLRMILEKMGIFDKRSTDPDMPELLQSVFGDVSIKELLLKLKNMVSAQKVNVVLFFSWESEKAIRDYFIVFKRNDSNMIMSDT